MSTLRMTEAEVLDHQRRIGKVVAPPAPAVVVPPVAKKAERSELEAEFERQLRTAGLFCRAEFHPFDGRQWRLDFAWPDKLIAVEVDGAVHRIKSRFKGDLDKGAALLLAGWRVLHVGRDQIQDGRALVWITQLLMGR